MKLSHITKALSVCSILTIIISFACGKKKIDYIQKTQDIEKKACACANNACAKLAFKEYLTLLEELKITRATGSTSELRQINEAAKKIQECLKKIGITEKEIDDQVQ